MGDFQESQRFFPIVLNEREGALLIAENIALSFFMPRAFSLLLC